MMRCNDTPDIGASEAKTNRDRLTLHDNAANSTYKACLSTSGHLAERSESKRRRQYQLHLYIRQLSNNRQARHPKSSKVRKCVICNTTCQEVRKHAFRCPEHRNFKLACGYSSRELADAHLYFDSHNKNDSLQSQLRLVATLQRHRRSHTEQLSYTARSYFDWESDRYPPGLTHARNRFPLHHTQGGGLHTRETESLIAARCPVCNRVCCGAMLHGFRCPRPPCVECVLELWHSPELMAHHLSGRLGERTQLQPIS